MDIGTTELLSILKDAGTLGLLVVILIGGSKKWWVWGWLYDAAIKDLREQLARSEQQGEEWKVLALKATTISEDFTEMKRGNVRSIREKAQE